MLNKKIYVDHSATTYVKEEVLKEMLPYFTENYGNPSSTYRLGQTAKADLENARDKIAKIFNIQSKEIIFTSCGSESNNLILKGIAHANIKKGKHIITTMIEHMSVLNTCKQLEKEGFEVTYLKPNEKGIITEDVLKAAIREDTILASIMFANNEIGTIQDIKKLANICKNSNVYFHTDAVQAVGNVELDLKDLNIDAMSISAHKFYGPKGIGLAYIKEGINFETLISGGHQERNHRAGTENIPFIIGMAKALEISNTDLEKYNKHLLKLREHTLNRILSEIDYVVLNGDRTKRLPGNLNVSIKAIEGESLLLMLDLKNIAASSGSACTSGSLDPSHVLLAIGLKHEVAHGSLRLSFGDQNTIEECDYIVDTLKDIVKHLREMSPINPEEI